MLPNRKLNIPQNCLECGGIIGRSLNAHIKVVSSGDILGWEGTAWIKTSWENLLAHYLFNTRWQDSIGTFWKGDQYTTC